MNLTWIHNTPICNPPLSPQGSSSGHSPIGTGASIGVILVLQKGGQPFTHSAPGTPTPPSTLSPVIPGDQKKLFAEEPRCHSLPVTLPSDWSCILCPPVLPTTDREMTKGHPDPQMISQPLRMASPAPYTYLRQHRGPLAPAGGLSPRIDVLAGPGLSPGQESQKSRHLPPGFPLARRRIQGYQLARRSKPEPAAAKVPASWSLGSKAMGVRVNALSALGLPPSFPQNKVTWHLCQVHLSLWQFSWSQGAKVPIQAGR